MRLISAPHCGVKLDWSDKHPFSHKTFHVTRGMDSVISSKDVRDVLWFTWYSELPCLGDVGVPGYSSSTCGVAHMQQTCDSCWIPYVEQQLENQGKKLTLRNVIEQVAATLAENQGYRCGGHRDFPSGHDKTYYIHKLLKRLQ